MPNPVYDRHTDVPLFEELSSVEVAAAIEVGAPAILPLGATEQHGAHLPLNTDTVQGIDVAKRTVARLSKEGIPLLMGPVIPFGPPQFLSEAPKDLPGTIALSHDTLRLLLDEVCRELVRHGFKTLYLLLANAETDPVMQIVAKEVTESTDCDVVTLNWLVGIRPRYQGILASPRPQGHGGEGETARLLATAPHLVRLDRARSYHPKPTPESEAHGDRLPYLGGAVGRYRCPDAVFEGFEGGITGDPELATAENGEKTYAVIVDWVSEVIRHDWRSRVGRKGARGGDRPR
jgi:creatinine amidohydrolase